MKYDNCIRHFAVFGFVLAVLGCFFGKPLVAHASNQTFTYELNIEDGSFIFNDNTHSDGFYSNASMYKLNNYMTYYMLYYIPVYNIDGSIIEYRFYLVGFHDTPYAILDNGTYTLMNISRVYSINYTLGSSIPSSNYVASSPHGYEPMLSYIEKDITGSETKMYDINVMWDNVLECSDGFVIYKDTPDSSETVFPTPPVITVEKSHLPKIMKEIPLGEVMTEVMILLPMMIVFLVGYLAFWKAFETFRKILKKA